MSDKTRPPPKDPQPGWIDEVRDRLAEWADRGVNPPRVPVPVPVRVRR